MKKLLIVVIILTAMTASVFAADEKLPFDFKTPPKDEAERQSRKAYIQERMMKRTGGMVARPGTLKGEIAYVNCQKSADKAWLEESIAYFTKETKFNITLKEGSFDLRNPVIQGNVSLFIVDDPALPGILVAPENRWTMVNIAPLKTEKEAFFKARVGKQLARGFAMLCGAASSNYPQSLTSGITKAEDLDEHLDARLPVDIIARFAPNLKPFGVTPVVMATYRRACTEGWAAQPTNDYQKAIWEEVHQLPTEPIKIKPEEKK